MVSFTLLVVIVASASLTFAWVCQACVFIARRRRQKLGHAPPISVLKPLKGAGEGLYENLAALAQQDYPRFELVFACEEIGDPALDVARRVKRDFPQVAITLVAGGKAIGFNPKVNNLHKAALVARYDYLLVSDADVRPGKHYLRDTAAELADPQVALVSNPFVGVDERSLGASLDNMHLGLFVVTSVCASQVLARHPLVVGKSMLIRKSALQAIGGWHRVKDVLAEDYLLGQLFQQAGYRVALSSHVLRAVNPTRSLSDFFARHVRWGQMQRRLAGFLYWLEPLMMPGAWLAMALTMLVCEPATPHAIPLLLALSGLMGLKALGDALFVRLVRGQWPTASGLVTLPIRDLIVVGIWLTAAVRTTVCWRGNRFKIGAGSRLSPLSTGAEATEAVAVRP